MNTLPNISSRPIRARLLKLDAMRLEQNATPIQCVRAAYDLIATAWQKAGVKLTETDLAERIPELVFEAAVEFNWINYPRRRLAKWVRSRPYSWIPNAPTIDWVDELIPDAELVGHIDPFNVEAHSKDDFLNRVLGGRVLEWRAKLYDPAVGKSLPVPNVRVPERSIPNPSALGRNIDQLRRECGWTIEELAEHTGLDKKLVLGHINKGRSPYPSTLKKYSMTFSKKIGRHVSVAELIT